MAKVQLHNVFARVSGGEVIEFPITMEMIKNRNAPLSMFYQVVYTNDPEVSIHQKYSLEFKVENRQVHVTIVVVDFTLDELLKKLASDANYLYPSAGRPKFENVPMESIQKVSELIEQEALKRLNALAESRRYSSIDSAPAFKDSHIEKFKAEAGRMIFLRSQVFSDLERYEQKIFTTELPIPLSSDEVFSHLEEISWGDTPAVPTAIEATILIEQEAEEKETDKDSLDPIMSFS